jgi:hypothetical protein
MKVMGQITGQLAAINDPRAIVIAAVPVTPNQLLQLTLYSRLLSLPLQSAPVEGS